MSHDAGCVSREQNKIKIRNSVFESNAARWAGAIASDINTTISWFECLFIHITQPSGEEHCMSSYRGVIIVNRSNLTHQNASKEGGAIHLYKSKLIIVTSIFKSCQGTLLNDLSPYTLGNLQNPLAG